MRVSTVRLTEVKQTYILLFKLFLSRCYTKFQPQGSYDLGSFMRVSTVRLTKVKRMIMNGTGFGCTIVQSNLSLFWQDRVELTICYPLVLPPLLVFKKTTLFPTPLCSNFLLIHSEWAHQFWAAVYKDCLLFWSTLRPVYRPAICVLLLGYAFCLLLGNIRCRVPKSSDSGF